MKKFKPPVIASKVRQSRASQFTMGKLPRRLCLLAMTIMLIFSTAAKAESDITTKAENYLNSIVTMTADFTQVDAGGNVTGGKFTLKRPGKFRWVYDNRQPLEIVSDGKQLVYYDKKLNEVTYTSLKDSLAGFLARKNISFNGDVKLLSSEDKNGMIRIKLTQKEKAEQGNLTMFFNNKDMKLSMLEIEDQNGGVTKIVFANQKFGEQIDDKTFRFIDPKFGRNVWERN